MSIREHRQRVLSAMESDIKHIKTIQNNRYKLEQYLIKESCFPAYIAEQAALEAIQAFNGRYNVMSISWAETRAYHLFAGKSMATA